LGQCHVRRRAASVFEIHDVDFVALSGLKKDD
jgi:hypothetical protein